MPKKRQKLGGLKLAKKQKKAKKAAKKKTPVAASVAQTAVVVKKEYKGAFYSSLPKIEPAFADKILQLEQEIGQRVVLLWHRGGQQQKCSEFNDLNYLVFAKNIQKLKRNEKIAILIDSPGGLARPAFKLASLLRKHCGGFSLIVPFYAKSAATLFALGADKIIMSRFAEFGPLDVQIFDAEKEERFSALEVVQAISRLNSEALQAIDQQMFFWLTRSRKKVDTLLPIASHFVSEMMQPLFDKIDTVKYTGMARILKVAEDYAQKLLKKHGLSKVDAEDIADKLTNAYSEHGYVIDYDELIDIGLKNVEEATGKLENILEDMAFMERASTILGPLKEV